MRDDELRAVFNSSSRIHHSSLLFNLVRRADASRGLRRGAAVADDAVLAEVDGQPLALGRALLGVLDAGGVAREHDDLVGGRVLAAVARAAPSGLRDDDAALRDGALDLVRVLEEVHVRDLARDAVVALPYVHVARVVEQALGVAV